MNILFASFEAVPFMKTGGLGDVAGSLPKSLKRKGCDIRVILPLLAIIPEEYRNQMKHVTDFYLYLGWRHLYCGIDMLKLNNVIYYFVDNAYYFGRDNAYGYYDDGERMAFFSKAITECIDYLPDFDVDILHCNDWHTALAPLFLREFYHDEKHQKIRTVFSIHNLKYQGQMSDYVLGDMLGIDPNSEAVRMLRENGQSVNLMKGAICSSDLLHTVSPSYAKEIETPFFGEHMELILQRRENDVWGILNGIDTTIYNPEKDIKIPANFSKKDLTGKKLCKAALQEELGLEVTDDVPLFIMIGRLTPQKGIDLLSCVLREMLELPIQLVVLGTGEKQYEDLFRNMSNEYRDKMRTLITFNDALSHRLYAAGDVFLMPSLYEPCGLSQMMAMRYGTLPLVRETGGLKDSVTPFSLSADSVKRSADSGKRSTRSVGKANGFSFANYNAHELLVAVRSIVDFFQNDRMTWEKLMLQAMRSDFSWNKAAKEYLKMYESLLDETEE